MAAPGAPEEKRMRLRYAGTCRICGAELAARTEATYEPASRTVRCVDHAAAPTAAPVVEVPVNGGVPGVSARREYERRTAAREERIRAKHPRIGGFLHAISDDPQSTKAWDTGALGEERLGNRLNELASDRVRVLHDRRMPGSRGNIDHLAVTASGVYVIDAKRYAGRPRLEVEGGLLRPRVEKLVVGGRDRSKLVDGVLKQVEAVRGLVADDLPVRGVLCFVEADWPLIGGAFSIRDVDVCWPKKLCPRLLADGPMPTDLIDSTHRLLASALAPA